MLYNGEVRQTMEKPVRGGQGLSNKQEVGQRGLCWNAHLHGDGDPQFGLMEIFRGNAGFLQGDNEGPIP